MMNNPSVTKSREVILLLERRVLGRGDSEINAGHLKVSKRNEESGRS